MPPDVCTAWPIAGPCSGRADVGRRIPLPEQHNGEQSHSHSSAMKIKETLARLRAKTTSTLMSPKRMDATIRAQPLPLLLAHAIHAQSRTLMLAATTSAMNVTLATV